VSTVTNRKQKRVKAKGVHRTCFVLELAALMLVSSEFQLTQKLTNY